MTFSAQDAKDWLAKYKWPVALAVVAIFGYSVGKDMALRDNAIDQAVATGEES